MGPLMSDRSRGWLPAACPVCGWDCPTAWSFFSLTAIGPVGPRNSWMVPVQIEIVGTQADCDITSFLLRRHLNVAKIITEHPSEVETRVVLYATLVTSPSKPDADDSGTADTAGNEGQS